MELKTRLFGKKVQGEPLKKLVEAIGEDPKILHTSLEKWITREVKGRCVLTPVNDGIEVDLYIFRKDIHDIDGTILADKYAIESGAMKILDGESFHRKGKISYKLGEK